MQDWIQAVGVIGVPSLVILALLWWFVKDFFPFWKERALKQIESEQRQDSSRIETYKHIADAIQKTREELKLIQNHMDNLRHHVEDLNKSASHNTFTLIGIDSKLHDSIRELKAKLDLIREIESEILSAIPKNKSNKY